MPTQVVRLTDIIGCGQAGLTARYTEMLELRHILRHADRGPVFSIESARHLELEGLMTGKSMAGAPVLRLLQTPGAMLRHSRAFPGTERFLSAGRGE